MESRTKSIAAAEVLQGTMEVLAEVLEIPIDSIRPNSRLEDLGFGKGIGQGDGAELKQGLDRKFGINIPDKASPGEEDYYKKLPRSSVQEVADYVLTLIPPPQ